MVGGKGRAWFTPRWVDESNLPTRAAAGTGTLDVLDVLDVDVGEAVVNPGEQCLSYARRSVWKRLDSDQSKGRGPPDGRCLLVMLGDGHSPHRHNSPVGSFWVQV